MTYLASFIRPSSTKDMGLSGMKLKTSMKNWMRGGMPENAKTNLQ